MKFFKHFTDAHRGQSIQQLLKKHGLAGVGFYWTLVELCAEKLNKKIDEEYTEAHCHFEFERSYLKAISGSRTYQLCDNYVSTLHQLCLISATSSDNLVIISMPKLLESLDRDAKRTRHARDTTAPKRKNKEKEEEKEKEKEYKDPVFDFERLFKLYPNKVNKEAGFERLKPQIKTLDDYSDFLKAIENYIRFLNLEKNKSWMSPKQWDVFCGAPTKKAKPWREWVSPDPSVFIGGKSDKDFDVMTAPLRGM